jgi:hypothetical protein
VGVIDFFVDVSDKADSIQASAISNFKLLEAKS